MIAFSHVSHHYGKNHALKDLSFELQPGRIYGFIGPNGAGKTTCFRICAGALNPSAGQVRLFDQGGPEQLAIRRRVGYLPERNPLFEEPDVLEHLAHVAGLRGLKGDAKRAAMRQAIARCQLESVLKARVHTLSKGYRQRLGLACAIVHEPDVLILDEPINGLDPQQIQAFIALLPDLAAKRTLIFSSHILAHLNGVCDHLFMLNRGQLVFDGTPQAWQAHDPEAGLLIDIGVAAESGLALLQDWLKSQQSTAQVSVRASSSAFQTFHLTGSWSSEQCARLTHLLAQQQLPLARLEQIAADSDRIFNHFTTTGGN